MLDPRVEADKGRSIISAKQKEARETPRDALLTGTHRPLARPVEAMGDGTPAMGKRHKKTHGICLRCGKRSFHYQKKTCAKCGYQDVACDRCWWHQWCPGCTEALGSGSRPSVLDLRPRSSAKGLAIRR